jgi:hypothetical protein
MGIVLLRRMNLEESLKLIENCAAQMNQLYGQIVFDEWAIVSLTAREGKILGYIGPRKEDFQKNFPQDLGALRSEIGAAHHGLGDFAFARHAFGTHFEGFLVLGDQVYLICNNTTRSMSDIAQDSRWLKAQVPFVELSDHFRGDPLVSRF